MTDIYDPLGLTYQPTDDANKIAEFWKNQFRPHDLCDEDHKRWMEARVQALFGAIDDTVFEEERSCHIWT
jgi:hypothetical protein